MSEIAIQVEHLNKMYKLYDKPMDRLKESLGLSKQKKYKEHYALKDVSFDIGEGECVGIIGTNGSGKSTAARCVMNLVKPQSGHIFYQKKSCFQLQRIRSILRKMADNFF